MAVANIMWRNCADKTLTALTETALASVESKVSLTDYWDFYCAFVHNISFLMVKNEKCPWDSQVVCLLHIFVLKCLRHTGWGTSSIDAFMMQNHPLL